MSNPTYDFEGPLDSNGVVQLGPEWTTETSDENQAATVAAYAFLGGLMGDNPSGGDHFLMLLATVPNTSYAEARIKVTWEGQGHFDFDYAHAGEAQDLFSVTATPDDGGNPIVLMNRSGSENFQNIAGVVPAGTYTWAFRYQRGNSEAQIPLAAIDNLVFHDATVIGAAAPAPYKRGELVRHGNANYLCLKDGTAVEPSDDQVNWVLLGLVATS